MHSRVKNYFPIREIEVILNKSSKLCILIRFSHSSSFNSTVSMLNNLLGQLPFFLFFCQPYPLLKAHQLIDFLTQHQPPNLLDPPSHLNLNKFEERQIKKNLHTTPMM